MKNNNNLEQDEIKKEEKDTRSILRKLYDEFKTGLAKNYKVLILITIVTLLILYLIYPSKNMNRNIVGGGPQENMAMGQMNKGNGGAGNGEGKKKSFISKFSPLSGGISIMSWVAQNILLLYLLLIFIVAIPSVPILLYITVFYFIMSGLFGKLYTI
jgi:hypothetical protein